MNRMVLKPVLAFGAALVLLGGCASYDGYDRGYRGGAYYGGSYSGYYEPDYYGHYGYYGQTYIPRGSYGGGYQRDGDHRDRVRNRDSDRGRDQNRSQDRGDRRDYSRSDTGGQGGRDVSRTQPQQNSAPAQQSFSGGSRDGRDGSSGDRSGSRSGGPEGRFGHPGTTANPL